MPTVKKQPRVVYELNPASPQADARKVTFRGDNWGLLFGEHRHESELVLCGPAETGKTVACAYRAHLICTQYPGAQGVLFRKELKSIAGSVLQTFKKQFKLELDAGIMEIWGGERAEFIQYKNGSRIWICGMDDPSKALSSERDFYWGNQLEECSLNDWEIIGTRATGRGAVYPHTQVFGDQNPGPKNHWIVQREKDGKLFRLHSYHTDNPSLYDEFTEEEFRKKFGGVTDALLLSMAVVIRNGKYYVPTAQGNRTMSKLSRLTGVRKLRLLYGKDATAEGAVFDNWNPEVNICHRERREMQRFLLAMDEGFVDPAVILVIGEDGDRRWHSFEEFHKRGVLQSKVAMNAVMLALDYQASFCACDASAPGLIAEVKNEFHKFNSNPVEYAKRSGSDRLMALAKPDSRIHCVVKSGNWRPNTDQSSINSVRDRIAVQGDGKPRYTTEGENGKAVCVEHDNEMQSWSHKEESDDVQHEDSHSPSALCFLHDALYGDQTGSTPDEWQNFMEESRTTQAVRKLDNRKPVPVAVEAEFELSKPMGAGGVQALLTEFKPDPADESY